VVLKKIYIYIKNNDAWQLAVVWALVLHQAFPKAASAKGLYFKPLHTGSFENIQILCTAYICSIHFKIIFKKTLPQAWIIFKLNRASPEISDLSHPTQERLGTVTSDTGTSSRPANAREQEEGIMPRAPFP